MILLRRFPRPSASEDHRNLHDPIPLAVHCAKRTKSQGRLPEIPPKHEYASRNDRYHRGQPLRERQLHANQTNTLRVELEDRRARRGSGTQPARDVVEA